MELQEPGNWLQLYGCIFTWKAALGFCVPCLLFLLAILAKCSSRVPCCLQWSRAAYANICVFTCRVREGVRGGGLQDYTILFMWTCREYSYQHPLPQLLITFLSSSPVLHLLLLTYFPLSLPVPLTPLSLIFLSCVKLFIELQCDAIYIHNTMRCRDVQGHTVWVFYKKHCTITWLYPQKS